MEYVRRKQRHADMFFCLIQWICRLNRIVVVTVRSQLDGDLHICIVKEEESVSPAGKMTVLWHIVCSVPIAVDRYSHFRNTIYVAYRQSFVIIRRHRALPQLSLWTG